MKGTSLSNTLDNMETYGFTWPGKKEASASADTSTTARLLPDRESSVDWDTTKNLFLEGDNLEVLKILQKKYQGKVKMIYIDPPYNTRKKFIYNDNFTIPKKEYIAKYNPQTEFELSGRYHTNWLNMMYPRLKLARNLLKDDGVIFISIGDHEVHNLRKICDEIFGEENFVSDFIVVRSEGGGLAKQVVRGHDYLLAFAKNISCFKPIKRPKDIRGKIVKKNEEEYWIEEDWLRKEFGKYGTCHYEEIIEFKGQEKKIEIDEGIKNDQYTLLPKGNGMHIVGRYRLIKEDGSKFYSILKHLNKNGVHDLEELQLSDYFDYPKPMSLIFDLIKGATFTSSNNNDLILDFFAGSATTAHAVMKLNAEDGGNRKFILVQLPEKCDEKSEAFKAGYKTIAEIGKERIRRAGKKIKEENPETSKDLDIGFRVYTVGE